MYDSLFVWGGGGGLGVKIMLYVGCKSLNNKKICLQLFVLFYVSETTLIAVSRQTYETVIS